jgi:hypothetical protein
MTERDRPKRAGATDARSGVERATGRDRPAWFALLDAWGAVGRPYREVAHWLTSEHGLSDWWTQKLIVEYEQARGVRGAGARRDGTFEASAGKVIRAPAATLRAAFRDRGAREAWLPGVALAERSSSSERTLRFDWDGGPTRLAVTVGPVGDDRCQVTVQHERLPDAASAAVSRAAWRERLTVLKEHLESRLADA